MQRAYHLTAAHVIAADESTDTTCFPLFATAATGVLAPKTDAALTFNSFTGALSATSFVGAVVGAATQVTVADESTNTTCFPLFVTAATGDLPPKSGTNLTFNSNTGLLSSTLMAAAFNGTLGATTPAAVSATTGSFAGIVLNTDATDATSATAAANKNAGGIACVKSAWIGAALRVVTTSQFDGNVTIGVTKFVVTASSGALALLGSISMRGVVALNLLDQTNFLGSIAVGTGLGSLTHSAGSEGRYHTAVGLGALQNTTSGSRCTAVGWNALAANTTGDFNSALGYQALVANMTGANNTAIGRFALGSSTGTGNVGLGYYAGAFTVGSNELYIDNQSRTNTAGDKAGAILYGVFNATPASQTLVINASLQVAQHVGIGAASSANADLWLNTGKLALVETTTPTADAGVAKLFSTSANDLHVQTGDGVDHTVNLSGASVVFKGYAAGDFGNSGTHYLAGFYEAPAAHVVLTIGGAVTQTYGTVGEMKAAHAFCVASGAGGTDLVLTVTGISIAEDGTRNDADSEIIVADADTATTDAYYETTKKWLGQITYTLTGAAGAFTFNYGFCKYDDFGDRDFTITDFEMVLEGAAGETGFDVQLLHHKATGWTYSAAAFTPGTGALVSSLTDNSATNDNFTSGDYVAYKRSALSTAVSGSTTEGALVKIVTAVNNSIQYGDCHIGVTL